MDERNLKVDIKHEQECPCREEGAQSPTASDSESIGSSSSNTSDENGPEEGLPETTDTRRMTKKRKYENMSIINLLIGRSK